MKYYTINEGSAKTANRMNSMSDYVENSATNEYISMCNNAENLAENQKGKVSEIYYEKIDILLDRYFRKLADYFNHKYRIDSMCPSILISGGGNFPVAKKKKQISAWETLQEEYTEVNNILDRIKKVGTGGISSDDPAAIEKLEEKIDRMKNKQDFSKRLNAYYRKNKTCVGFDGISEETAKSIDAQTLFNQPVPSYELTSIRNKIKAAEKRIRGITSIKENPIEGWDFNGGEVVANAEENRLQILFDEKPDEEMRTNLKSHGFRWSPKNGAWQRLLNNNAIYATKHYLKLVPLTSR